MTTPYRTLISAGELAALLANGPRPVIVDVSFDLADTASGERRHRESHLPGAHYLHLDRDLSGAKTGANGRHPLPTREAFSRTVGALGIRPATQVVCVDAQGGVFAARAWWLLRWLGHADVAVLDGGIAAWQRAGGALTSEPSLVPGGAPYPERPSLAPSVDAGAVAARPPLSMLLDARSGERFRGESVGHFGDSMQIAQSNDDPYLVIFTQNATSALKLVGESYPFAPGGNYLLTFDNHNSVNGIREFARAASCFSAKDHQSFEQFLQLIDGKTTGALRASIGLASNFADVHTYVQFAKTFIDQSY